MNKQEEKKYEKFITTHPNNLQDYALEFACENKEAFYQHLDEQGYL